MSFVSRLFGPKVDAAHEKLVAEQAQAAQMQQAALIAAANTVLATNGQPTLTEMAQKTYKQGQALLGQSEAKKAEAAKIMEQARQLGDQGSDLVSAANIFLP